MGADQHLAIELSAGNGTPQRSWWLLEQAVFQLCWIYRPRIDPVPHCSEDVFAASGLVPLGNNELLSLFLAVCTVHVKVCRLTFLTLPVC